MLKDEKLNLNLYQNLNSNQAPEDFHHVAFKTINYEAMVDFYTKLFGCKPLYESEELTFLAFDEEHHRVAIANTSGIFKNLGFIPKTIMRIKNWMNRSLPSIVGLDHISYKLNPIEKWFEFYHKAKDEGLEPYWTINHGWITGMYYKDPDGHLVEIFFEHWRNQEEFKINISPDLNGNPIIGHFTFLFLSLSTIHLIGSIPNFVQYLSGIIFDHESKIIKTVAPAKN